MRAETGLGGMAAATMPITKERMEPAICRAPSREVINQLDMAMALAQRINSLDLIEVEGGSVGARQPSERMACNLASFRVVNASSDRKLDLMHRHRCREHQGLP